VSPANVKPSAPMSAIETLAARAGFEVEWLDAHKSTQRVPESTLRVLLERLGLPCGNATQLKHSMTTLDAELSGRKLPPLITAEVDRAIALPVSAAKSGARYRIELESGAVIDGRFTSPKGEIALLSPISEPGYHALIINDHHTTIAVAPSRCYTIGDAWRALHDDAADAAPPLWGVAAQVYGLRRPGDAELAIFRRSRRSPSKARNAAATRSRSARCTRCSARSRRSSVPIRRRRACS
jgi:4-alpha-glucanotransferase